MALADGVSFQAQSSGTGSFVFATARASFLTPAQAVTIGELVNGTTYSYLAQDSLTAPTQREWGRGVFTAATSTFTRVVLGGVDKGTAHGAGSAVNFTVAPTVSLTVLAEDLSSVPTAGRTILTQATSYYITTTGNDSNPGTLASPWLTLQHANDWIASNIDFNNQEVSVNIGAGTFAGVSLTPNVGGGRIKYIGATWQPTTTTLTASQDGDCIDVFNYPLGSTAVGISQVTLVPNGGYAVATYAQCHLELGGGGAGIVFGSVTNSAGIGVYAEGLCLLTDNGNQTTIDVGATQLLSFMYLTAGAVYKKYGNWLFTTPVATGNGFMFVDNNSAFVNLDGDTFYTNGPVTPGGIPFHLRTGGTIQLEESYFGDVTYGVVEDGQFQWNISDPLAIPTDPSTKSIQAPTNGFSIAFPESTYTLILKPAGTLATGSIALPNFNYNSKIVVIKSTQQVTSLTITAPTSGGSGVALGSYNSGTGQVTLTLGLPLFQFYGIPGQSITISGITGTGSVASVNGTFTADAGTSPSGLTVKYTIASGLTLTITPATGLAASTPDVFGAPTTIALGGRIEAEYDLTTNAWYL